MPDHLDQIATPTSEDEEMTAMGIATQHLLDLESQAGSNWAFIFLAATLLTLFSGVALSAKRLQDCDKPAGPAWLFIILDIFMFIALCFFPGTPGPNRHGAASNARL